MNTQYAVFNPQEKPAEELPVIYGFNNGGAEGFMYGQLIAEDGTPLGNHLCSHEGFMLGDLGISKGSRSDRHESFKKHYPEGYRMDFVSRADIDSHESLLKAIKLANKAGEKENEQVSN